MSSKKKIKIFKIILTIIAVTIIIGITINLFPVIKDISTTEGQQKFKEKVNNSKLQGVLSIIGLQIAQIFLFIIPGEPVEILAGMCFGAIWGAIIIMVACLIITTMIVLLVNKYGKRFIYNFSNKEKIEKIEKSKLFQNPKKIEYIMTILFLIPGTPKDLLVYVAGLLPIKPVRFIFISTIARFPSIISSTIAGENLAIGNWKLSVVLYLAIVVIVAIFVFIVNKFDKDKTAEEALKSLRK